MEMKPIFDFLKELRMPSIAKPYSAETIEEYERFLINRLYEMKACVAECIMTNPSADLGFAKDELLVFGAVWKAKRRLLDGPIIEEIKGGVSANDLKRFWKENPEAHLADIILEAIEEAKRSVNNERMCPTSVGNGETNDNTSTRKQEKVMEKSVLNVKEVAERFGLAINNVKDKQWRDRNGFPYQQCIKGGKVIFYADEVEEWVEKRRA